MQRLIIIFFFFASFSSFGQENQEIICKDLSHIIEMEQHSHQQLIDFRANDLTQNYDLKYHRLEWEVDPAINYINGTVTSYFIPIEDDFTQINFDFSSNMTINAIIHHGDTLSYTQSADDNLQINLPDTIPNGQLDSIQVQYEGAPLSTGFGDFEQSFHQGTPVLWTLSEPYGAKVWWPCKQDLNDKIDSTDIIIRTLSDYRAASNGILVNEEKDGDFMVYTWKHRYPIPAYLIAIAVTNYAVFSDFVELENGDSLEILNYVYPENLTNAEIQLENTVEMMELFNELFGTYPFAKEKYGHAQFGWGGGMEHQTMSFMGGFSYGLQAHELAHQWFGDKVTCGSWEDIWLNEGFATYLTGLTSEFLKDGNAWHRWKKDQIDNVVRFPWGSVWVDNTNSVWRIFDGRLSYSKGSLLLHMLRWKLGDGDFFQAIRNYIDDPLLSYGYATTENLQSHLESQSGQDLNEFLNDWFYGQGYPSYQITWSNLGEKVKIKVEQTTSHNSVEFFEMPIPILVMGESQDSLLRLDHSYSGEEFEIELPFQVNSLSFDPELWLISAENTIEEQIISSVSSNDLLEAIRISPNPFNNMLRIGIQKDQKVEQIEIINAQGKYIDKVYSPGDNININTEYWPSGIYAIHFKSGKKNAVLKAIKL
jgi:aminopeptidase N